jgi:hypothetical protein
MKKTLTIISLLVGAAGLHAQGTINWADLVTGQFQINVFSPGNTPTVQTQGDAAGDLGGPVTQTYPGSVYLGGTATGTGSGAAGYYNGNLYTVGLYLDTSATAVANDVKTGVPVATSGIITTGGQGNGGIWGTSGLTSIDSAIAPGTQVYVEIAAWYNGGGATSYATALAAGVPHGEGSVSTSEATLGGQGASGPPATAPNIAGLGLTSFDLTTSTPEPSTIALGVMGASAFLFRRRNK